ncbi:hypothetical protein PL11_009490 [Lentilactobacillus curieae]|uniref:Uncharacterized protein n=1 Tax=Lentilactobacillus curieae TaxID=1138822 RepID=A0A1S6QKH5_9LACO|nr:hypothetical protein [Lentilactobacillus curieae]AQW22138.1 hypothetical protein PL11_009490 [Lentilactobacillus curieae]
METFRIRFINRITDETIRIGYTAILENNQSPTIYEGEQVFYRSFLNPDLLITGEAALSSIENIFSAIPKEYILKQVAFEDSHNFDLLRVPSKELFSNYMIKHKLLNRVRYHRNKEDKPVIDTNLITELRLG